MMGQASASSDGGADGSYLDMLEEHKRKSEGLARSGGDLWAYICGEKMWASHKYSVLGWGPVENPEKFAVGLILKEAYLLY